MILRRMAGMAAITFALVLGGCAHAPDTAYAGAEWAPAPPVGVSSFYQALEPWGRWVYEPRWGWCWTPVGVGVEWRPYTLGRWYVTDAGWTWVDDEPWGWIPFHYGRWVYDAALGWLWVPGDTWAPAWVAWRCDDDWIGWAPLPPQADWSPTYGLRFSRADLVPSHAWCFLPARRMLDSDVHQALVSVARNPTLLARTRNATRYRMRAGRPVDAGVQRGLVERATGRRLHVVKLRDAVRPPRGADRYAANGALATYRPRVEGNFDRAAPPAMMRARRTARPGTVHDQAGRDLLRRQLDERLGRERTRMAQRHRAERRNAASARDSKALRSRQQAEREAFERHAERARHVQGERWRRGLQQPGHPHRGRDSGRGAGGRHGHR